MTNEDRDIINQFIARVGGAPAASGFASGSGAEDFFGESAETSGGEILDLLRAGAGLYGAGGQGERD